MTARRLNPPPDPDDPRLDAGLLLLTGLAILLGIVVTLNPYASAQQYLCLGAVGVMVLGGVAFLLRMRS